jgi:hypothetical protein
MYSINQQKPADSDDQRLLTQIYEYVNAGKTLITPSTNQSITLFFKAKEPAPAVIWHFIFFQIY